MVCCTQAFICGTCINTTNQQSGQHNTHNNTTGTPQLHTSFSASSFIVSFTRLRVICMYMSLDCYCCRICSSSAYSKTSHSQQSTSHENSRNVRRCGRGALS